MIEMNEKKQQVELKHGQKGVDKEQDVALLIGHIMRIGVIFAAIVMLIGLLLLFIRHGGGYTTKDFFPTTLTGIVTGICALRPAAIMMGGLFLLLLTPVLRVIVSIYSFIKEKDMLYVVLTTIVLLILIFSFIMGHSR